MKTCMYRTFIILFLYFAQRSSAQCWEEVGGGFNSLGRSFYADSTNNLLYTGGNFSIAGGISAYQIAKWNGTTWDSLAGGSQPLPVSAITNYNGEIYAGGNFFGNNDIFNGKWNGTNWDTLVGGPNGNIGCFYQFNNELYVGGSFDSIGNAVANSLAKYNGTMWTDVHGFGNFNIASPNSIGAIINYHGELYVGGVFADSLSSGFHVNIAKWNGTNWQRVGNGLIGGLAGVDAFAIYRDTLYISGTFDQSAGNAGNYIVKWDGNNYYDVGGGMDNPVDRLVVYGDRLYAVGVFDHAGGVSAKKIAIWDGNSWSALSPDSFNNNIAALTFLNDELYVTGGFTYVGGLPINYVAKYTCSLGTNEVAKDGNEITIYPSPVSNNLIIEISGIVSEKKHLCIYNMLGEEVLKEDFSSQKYSVNLSGLAGGIYLAEVRNGKNMVRKKLVKE